MNTLIRQLRIAAWALTTTGLLVVCGCVLVLLLTRGYENTIRNAGFPVEATHTCVWLCHRVEHAWCGLMVACVVIVTCGLSNFELARRLRNEASHPRPGPAPSADSSAHGG